MPYSLAADAVLVLHLAFILFASLGGLLVAWRPRIAGLHLPALAWAAWIVATHGICPLTPLENALRQRAGEAGYGGGFIENWLALVLVAANTLLYGWALFRIRRRSAS